ncbi:MAG: EAL domain-containing protein [Erysipelotrichaceae bacterium]|nr:EAL domain-containing protein [Erysipelotrichaceae bacterium]
MRSIRTKFTLLTVCTIVAALGIATAIGVISIRKIGRNDADQMMHLTATTGALNLESYFESVEHSVDVVSTLVQDSLEEMPFDQLEAQVERSRNLFGRIANNTNGVLTYYFRIDPEVSDTIKGFWYVNLDGKGFKEHEVTDISQYDTNDTSKLVWFTVPKATGEGLWLPPYYTENLDIMVTSYNVPVYWNNTFVGVIGIEIEYETLAKEVENIEIFDSGYAFILDEDSNVIYHPKMDAVKLDIHAIDKDHVDKYIGSNHIEYKFEGIEKEAVWIPLSNGMRIYVTAPVSEIDSGWQNMIKNIIYASVAILTIVIAVLMRFTYHLTKPLTELTQAAKEADKGNYEFALEYNQDDEVGILTRTFKQLAAHTKEHINALNKQAYVDDLTSVRNKAAYTEYIEDLQKRLDKGESINFAVGVFDCDNLKSINDQYGHDKGDEYLKTACRLICRVFQHSPVFRIGGDEFAVIMQNDDYNNRQKLADQFYTESDRINNSADNEWYHVHTAMGIATYDPKLDKNVFETVRRADKLMYDNKQNGRVSETSKSGNFFFVESDELYWKEQYILDSFKTALEEHWIKVYYMPIMRLRNSKLTILEALARWIDPVRGIIMPNEFIYVLSRYHQIHLLDMYMVEEVCREFGEREKGGLPTIPVSVNISAQDFDYIDVPSSLKQITEKYDLTPDDIIVEITEHDVAKSKDNFKEALKQLHEYGFRLWIDDFGSGYSSLNVLSQYDVDRIKIDMDLIRHLDDNNGANRKVLEAMVKVCNEIGIGTLAEGIEKEEQLEFLKEIGCDLAQGFYLYKPEPIDVSIYKFKHRTEDIPHESDEERVESFNQSKEKK